MTGLLELVVVVGAGGAIFAAVKHTDQRKTGRTGKGRRIPRQSKLVKIYNSTGAKPVTSSDAAGATAELTGRAIGATARRTSRRWRAIRTAASRGRDRLADRTAPRWEQRRTTRTEPFIDRLRAVQAVRRERGWRGLRPSLSRRPPEPPPAPAAPPAPPSAPTAPHPPARHLRAVPSPAPKGTTVTTTSDLMAPAAIAAPADWAAVIDRTANFEPEDDVALIEWMKAEAVGVVGYAESLEAVRETCVTAIGLDPSAVSGITTYSEAVSETADRMSEALTQFLTVYEEVQKLVGEGVVMPYNGRWFGGATG